MTLIISSLDKSFVVMTADSVVTTYFSDGSVEYDTRSKSFVFSGVGCVTTWGEQIHNRIGTFFHDQEISSDKYSVVELADVTHRYLTEIYRPKDDNLDEVGYHIGGFDTDGNPRVFHTFWGFDRPKPPEQEFPDYKFYDHSDWKFVYNGKNDLAHVVVQKLIEQLENNKDVRYDLSSLEGNIKFCDFVARFAAELTPEVGPPFRTFVIQNDNSIEEIKNDSFCPVEIDEKFIANPDSEPIILFPDESDDESPVSSLPTGIVLPEELLDPSYKGGTISKLNPGGRILVCSSCGKKYNDNENVLGVVSLCPVCRKTV